MKAVAATACRGKSGGMRHSTNRWIAPVFAFAVAASLVAQQAAAPPVAAPHAVNGRVDQIGALRVLHVFGSAKERGYAHGFLLGKDIAAILVAEWTKRFARHQPLLQQARGALGRLVVYPDDVRAEIDALFAGIVDSGASRDMPELEREFDATDLLVANALDVFGLMGCSSFTLWGDQVVGGGVLTGRNFDWPLTGEHLLTATMLVVQHFDDGRAVASVSWPGFVGTVTGVSGDGVAAFLHVGSAKITMTPEPESWPTAVAARAILAAGAGTDAPVTFERARRLLEFTSPPAGYLTHVVLPRAPADGPPVAVFETDAESSVIARLDPGACVLTNHFRTRTDGRKASRDSLDREQRVTKGIGGCLDTGDHKVSIEEAWTLLQSVERGGSHAFGTLHSLVFRHEPWHFELRVALLGDEGVVAAPDSDRRFSLAREQVFPADGKEPARR